MGIQIYFTQQPTTPTHFRSKKYVLRVGLNPFKEYKLGGKAREWVLYPTHPMLTLANTCTPCTYHTISRGQEGSYPTLVRSWSTLMTNCFAK